MKKLLIISIILLFAASTFTAFAAGGKNHSSKGKGTTSTGTDSQGTASQPRTGR